MAGTQDMLNAHLKKVTGTLQKGDYVGAFKDLDAAKDYAKRNRIEKLTVSGKEVRAVEEMERMTLEVVKFALSRGQYKVARYSLDRAKEYAKLNRIDTAGELEKPDKQVDAKAAITIFNAAKAEFANKKYSDALKSLKEADKFAVKAEGKVPPAFNELRQKIYVTNLTEIITESGKLIDEGRKPEALSKLSFAEYDIDEAKNKIGNNPEIEELAKRLSAMRETAGN